MSDWIENTGEIPVGEGVLVDVQHRSGHIFEAEKAGEYRSHAEDWSLGTTGGIVDDSGDIIFWRLHQGE